MSSCCTGRRAAWRHAPALRAATALAAPGPAHAGPSGLAKGSVRLQYLGHHPLVLRGPFSGRLYDVDGERRLLDAAAADAPAMLRSGWFAAE